MDRFKFRAWDGKQMYYDIASLHFMKDGHIETTIEDENEGIVNIGCTSKNCFVGTDIKLMQRTGLKDSKGNLIFEGDVVVEQETVMSDCGIDLTGYIAIRIDKEFKYFNGSIGERRYGRIAHVVTWYNESCGFEPFSDSFGNCGHCGGGLDPSQIEVIGNTREHPDLIPNKD